MPARQRPHPAGPAAPRTASPLRLVRRGTALAHPPGDAQADCGEALVVIDGVERKAHDLVVDLPHSDDAFVKAFPAETTEAFCDGHNAAVHDFGGVPRRIVYDDTTLAVARMLGDGTRQRTRVFSELQSHWHTDLSIYAQKYLDAIALRLNTRPRKTLGYRTPAVTLAETVASTG